MTDTHAGPDTDHTKSSTDHSEEKKRSNARNSETPQESTTKDRPTTSLERILSVDTSYLDTLFAIGMLVFFAVLLAYTPRYAADSQLFPLVIGIPAVVMLGGLLLVQFSSRLQKVIDNFATTNPFELEELEQLDTEGSTESISIIERRKKVMTISTWTIVLFLFVELVGFLIAIFVFLLGFYRYQAREGWIRSLGYTIIIWAMIYIIFEVVMNTTLYRGLFDVGLTL